MMTFYFGGAREKSNGINDRNVHAKPGCRFCNVSKNGGFDIVSETPHIMVFRDRDPAAKEHLLVVPVKHIPSVKVLRYEDVSLLRDMENAGHQALNALGIAAGDRRLGFHIPPFNSVMHLHLHVLGLPYKSSYRLAKYPISAGSGGRSKGLSWFVEIRQAIRVLERGGQIGILPC